MFAALIEKGTRRLPSNVLFFYFALDLGCLTGSFAHIVELRSSYAARPYYFNLVDSGE